MPPASSSSPEAKARGGVEEAGDGIAGAVARSSSRAWTTTERTGSVAERHQYHLLLLKMIFNNNYTLIFRKGKFFMFHCEHEGGRCNQPSCHCEGSRMGAHGNPNPFKKYIYPKNEIATPSAPQKARNDNRMDQKSVIARLSEGKPWQSQFLQQNLSLRARRRRAWQSLFFKNFLLKTRLPRLNANAFNARNDNKVSARNGGDCHAFCSAEGLQ
jgi:hypothetical protein